LEEEEKIRTLNGTSKVMYASMEDKERKRPIIINSFHHHHHPK
jgi:hypothetical protein